MLTFSYTISPALKKALEHIDRTQNKMLLEQLSLQDDTRLRWETLVARLLTLNRDSQRKIKKSELTALLKPDAKKSLLEEEALFLSYKKAYDYIKYSWLLNPKQFHTADLKTLISFFGKESIDEKAATKTLSFIQVNPEHPVIQAALSYVLFLPLLPGTKKGEQIAFSISQLFLYKNGYDFRGLLNLEEYVSRNREQLVNILGKAQSEHMVSSYLEFFTQGVVEQVDKAYKKLQKRTFDLPLPEEFFALTDRQKEIIALFDQPGAQITNRMIQKKFRVSQITASRELTKLVTLNLILPAGRGRSVYYTRV